MDIMKKNKEVNQKIDNISVNNTLNYSSVSSSQNNFISGNTQGGYQQIIPQGQQNIVYVNNNLPNNFLVKNEQTMQKNIQENSPNFNNYLSQQPPVQLIQQENIKNMENFNNLNS